MLNDKEYEEFFNRTLVLIENAVNFLKRNKHIIAYNKMIGVYNKLDGLEEEYKTSLGIEMIKNRSVIYYLKEGRYEDAGKSLSELKNNLYKIYGDIKKKNENNTN